MEWERKWLQLGARGELKDGESNKWLRYTQTAAVLSQLLANETSMQSSGYDQDVLCERRSLAVLKVHEATFFYGPVNKQRDRALDARNSNLQELT